MTLAPLPATFTRVDGQFKKTFESLIHRWQQGKQTDGDKRMLEQCLFSFSDYNELTDDFNLRHGVELVNNRIILNEAASEVHEYMGGVCDDWITNVYGQQHLFKLRSASTYSLLIYYVPNFKGMLYNAASAKQPDASFRPKLLPAPTRQNCLKYQPGTLKHYPSFVFEVAVSHEDRERLLTDANDKYFNGNTSVQVWLGIKLDLVNKIFWAGWGQRNLSSVGMRLMEQTEDNAGVTTFLPVYPYPVIPLVGQFLIPSSLIFHNLQLPAGMPSNLVIPLEEIRSKLEEGIDLL